MDLLEAFPTEQACLQYLINICHNGKITCPNCKSTKTSIHNGEGRIVKTSMSILQKAFCLSPAVGSFLPHKTSFKNFSKFKRVFIVQM